jgi:putative MATE family efflux protein
MSKPNPVINTRAFKRDLTKGSIIGNLWSLSWPMLITNTINTLGPAIDMIWVGRLGASSIAGVGVSGMAVMMVNSLLNGIFTGIIALIARNIGAGELKPVNRIAQQGFLIAGFFSIFTAAIGIFLARPILLALGVEQSVVNEGAAYMRILLIGMVTMASVQVAQSIMQASGDTMTPMKISVGFRILQMLLCPAFVFGYWVFPKFGVSGAALSNVVAQAIGGIVILWILFSGRSRIKVSLKNISIDWNIIWRAIRIGIPASLTQMERSFADLIMVKLFTPFGTLAVAAHSLAQRIDGFVQMPGGGLGQGAAVIVGQNLGAKQPDRATKSAWIAAAIATGISLACAFVIWFWVEDVVGIFSNDTGLIDTASSFLRIQVAAYLVWGIVIALSLCLNGAGDTLIPMITNFVSMWGFQIGLGYLLSRYTDLGVIGLRWGISIGVLVRAVIYVMYFRTGRWKYKRV